MWFGAQEVLQILYTCLLDIYTSIQIVFCIYFDKHTELCVLVFLDLSKPKVKTIRDALLFF